MIIGIIRPDFKRQKSLYIAFSRSLSRVLNISCISPHLCTAMYQRVPINKYPLLFNVINKNVLGIFFSFTSVVIIQVSSNSDAVTVIDASTRF